MTADNPDPKFYRDMLTKLAELFTPKEYVNPVGLRILGEEIDKAFEELKEKIENEEAKDQIQTDPR